MSDSIFEQNSFIPQNLRDVNNLSGFSFESPTGSPIESVPTLEPNLLIEQSGLISNSTPDSPLLEQVSSPSDLGIPEETNQSQTNLPRINSFFEPKISPENISINLENLNRIDQEQIREDLGFAPFIWYNNIQIEYRDIESFTLKYENNIPTIKMFFKDSFGIMKQIGFPGDDTLITVFFNSRSKNLRSIKMDFKVFTFNDLGNGSFSISGIVNIPRLYTKKFESFNKKTSHQTIREIAKSLDCGFCSNLNDTNDLMTWINPGNSSLEFINDILKNSYVSDDSFIYYYIDFYYNICYVDLNKELTRDINQDVMVNSMGFDKVKLEEGQGEERLIPIILSNDNSFESSNGFISDYNINNKSTKVSITNSYKTLSKTWNVNNKEFLLFDIETITPDGKNDIILKGSMEDPTFFNENVEAIWLGKLETDNSHLNFNYSTIQNSRNLDEITKIGATLTLSSPNLNLYLFQKVKVLFSAKKLTPTHEEQFFKRLSGDWLIIGMEIKFDGGRSYQVLNVIKTTLSMTPEESEKAVSPTERSNQDSFERNNNPIDPNQDPPTDIITQVPPTPSQTPQEFDISPSGLSPIKDIIGRYESNNNYDIANTGGSAKKSTTGVRGLSITQLKSFQSLPEGDPARVFAAGKYQIIPVTFRAALKSLNLPESTIFNQETQELFGDYLLLGKRKRLGDFLKGNNSGAKQDLINAINDVGYEWASMPVITKSGSGQVVGDVETGIDKNANYGGQGANPAKSKVDVGTIAKALIKSRIQYSGKWPTYLPPYYEGQQPMMA